MLAAEDANIDTVSPFFSIHTKWVKCALKMANFGNKEKMAVDAGKCTKYIKKKLRLTLSCQWLGEWLRGTKLNGNNWLGRWLL